MHSLVTRLVQKRLIFPAQPGKSNSKTIARQLDGALMSVGFKLSADLLANLGALESKAVFESAAILLDATRKLVGDHVQHNAYFKDFPKGVPDTLEFWGGLLARYYEATGGLTNNLLDFPTYGNYQHSYEDLVAAHKAFKPRKGSVELKVINLGDSETAELVGLYKGLATSRVPLNPEDRALLEELYRADFAATVDVPVRENKAIINALRLQANNLSAIQADTPIDVLRLAAHLSGGDVTLATATKFAAFKRPVRRALIHLIDGVLVDNPERMEDANAYREQFKRLGERLHVGEYQRKYPLANKLFQFARGSVTVPIWGAKVHDAIQNGRLKRATDLLSEKPGYLIRSIDKLARDSNDEQFQYLLEVVRASAKHVSGRVLLSVIEHLDNRRAKTDHRLFVNRNGGGWATSSTLEPLTAKHIERLQSALWKDLARRIAADQTLLIDPSLDSVAVPISEKTKGEGFRVLPRGSVFNLDATKPVLRFFLYWHQKSQRTDYDLSAAMYDASFNMIGQVSWTNLRYSDGNANVPALHSGDLTDATDGATEFIDVILDKLPGECAYLAPTVNLFTGELYKDCAECFFGFMSRDLAERGKPFEPATVQTRFDLRGDKNVAMPLVFQRTESGWQAKWLDLYLKGRPSGNRVEATKFSTELLAKSLVNRRYLTVGRLLEIHREKAAKVLTKVPTRAVKNLTYIGLSQPEGLPEGTTVITLDSLKQLIPA